MLSALRQLETRADGFASPDAPQPIPDQVSLVPASPEESASPPSAPEAPPAVEDPLSPGVGDALPPEAPLWLPTEMMPADEPAMSGPLTSPTLVLKAPPKLPPATQPPISDPSANPAYDGLAALLSQPLPDRLRETPQPASPKLISKPADVLKARPPADAEDRAPSLSPLEARIKRNAVQDPLSGQMRAFTRKLVQQFSGIQPATVLFVGADVGDHTSVVAAHLGALLAEQNQGDVLLIDADVARRTLSAGFGRDNHRGLAELLGESIADGPSPIHATITHALSILPCGRGAFPAATQLETRIPLLLSGLSERWPWIVVQGGAADSALTGSFAGACQGSYLVVRLGQTTPTEAAEALAILNAAGACILGCVATNAP
jgi:Mrp family chromosome partitioning ATPase